MDKLRFHGVVREGQSIQPRCGQCIVCKVWMKLKHLAER